MAHRALLLGRNDGQALQWCCRYEPDNGDPDGLGECDVQRMRDALRARDYQHVQIVGADHASEGAVVDLVKAELRACKQGDVFLFYFSGHLQGLGGSPQLLLSGGAYPEALPVDRLIQLLQDTKVTAAAHKLVILDCCYADTACEVWIPGQHDGVRFLLATRGHQRAKELPGLRGGLFTHYLHEALTNPLHWDPYAPSPLVTADGLIHSNALLLWLKDQIQTHWPRLGGQGEPPEPIADSAQDQPVLVTRVEIDTGWPARLATGLDVALQQIDPSAKQCTRAYQHCRELAAGHPALAACPDGVDRRWMLGQLLVAGHYSESSHLPLPLYTFVSQLARDLPESQPLRDWLDDARRWLQETCGLAPHMIDAAEVPRPRAAPRCQPDPYLMVQVEPDLYTPEVTVSWTFYPDRDRLPPPNGRGSVTLSDVADHVAVARAIAGAVAVTPTSVRRPRIELLLPFALLSSDTFVDRIERSPWRRNGACSDVPPRSGQLAVYFPLVLRCRERWTLTDQGGDHGGAALRDYWPQRVGCLQQPAAPPCLEWLPKGVCDRLPDAALSHLAASPDRDQHRTLALACPDPITDAGQLQEVLENGVPILLWPRRPASDGLLEGLSACVAGKHADRPLAGLPGRLREYRCAHPCDFSLLWDDPERPLLQAMLTALRTDDAFP